MKDCIEPSPPLHRRKGSDRRGRSDPAVKSLEVTEYITHSMTCNSYRIDAFSHYCSLLIADHDMHVHPLSTSPPEAITSIVADKRD